MNNPKKPLKTELHHWWPRTLADHWVAPDQMVSVIAPDGNVTRAPPGQFGAITNAHHMKMGGPWDSTFEPIFNHPDGEIGNFVAWLSTLEASITGSDRPMVERILAQPLPEDRRLQLARVTASLLARSPRVRHVIRLTTAAYQADFGLIEPKIDKTLTALNQRHLYDAYRTPMETSGRWAILFGDSREFIAGDGFFHNFPASANAIHSGRKLILPILPTIAIAYMLPMSHPSEPRLVTLRVDSDETERLNELVQVYASKFLFFRTEQPDVLPVYAADGHREFSYHRHDWADVLLDELSQYNHWGKGGSPAITQRRQFSRWIDGDGLVGHLGGDW